MSGDEHFLARWAWRKQAAKRANEPEQARTEAEAVPPLSLATGEGDHAQHGGGGTHTRRGQPSHPPPPSAVPLPRYAGEEPLADIARVSAPGHAEPLPSVDDLTAESDIRAFLQQDVAPALRQAALRRAWALDPAIRDFVSPAEYAWDFNDPNSMAGFSPAAEPMDLGGFFSGESAAVAEDHAQHSLSLSGEAEPERSSEPGAGAEAAADARSPHPLGLRRVGLSPDESGEEPSAGASDASSDDAPPRRHGGALPR